MKKLDFSYLKKKYSFLDETDVNKLNKFFNSEEITEILQEVEIWRKDFIRAIIYGEVFLLVIITVVFLLWAWPLAFQYWAFFMLWLFSMILMWYFSSGLDVKSKLVHKFVNIIAPWIHYAKDWKLYRETPNVIYKKTWLIDKFDRIDSREDSIRFSLWEDQSEQNTGKKSIDIEWFELATSEKSTHKQTDTNWNTTTKTAYSENNHCYIIKITFNNPRFLFNSYIRLKENPRPILSFFITLFLSSFYSLLTIPFILIIYQEIIQKYIYNIPLSVDVLWWILFAIIFSVIYWAMIDKDKNKIVKMENIDFEKKFDVESEDEIEARKVLTPSFMYRILDFTNKVSQSRRYELYFNKNEIYIKHELTWKYLEFSPFRSTFSNLRAYIEFYLELKNISELSEDLNLFYYDNWVY